MGMVNENEIYMQVLENQRLIMKYLMCLGDLHEQEASAAMSRTERMLAEMHMEARL